MKIVDSQVHVWRAETPDRPWSPGRTAHLDTPIDYENLIERMDEAGVDRGVLVPPSWEGDRLDYSLEAAAKYPDRFAVMGRIPLAKPEEARKLLETWKQQPGLLGVRLTFHHEWDKPWMTNGVADWFWPVAERLGIPVMLNMPRLQTEVGEIARRHPGLRIIVDHMGRLRTVFDDDIKREFGLTEALAKYPNVHVKLTTISDCSTQPYPCRNIHDAIRSLITAFSPRRSFWGTDLSSMLLRKKLTYRQAVTFFTEEMDFLSADDLEWIMGKGVCECLGWPL